MSCGRCGHDVALHGRRGYGACRHGSASPLALAVEAARLAVISGLDQNATRAVIDRAFTEAPALCGCKRYRKTGGRPPCA
jgi:hypothetical protein